MNVINKHIIDFINLIKRDQSIELYNEAGFQHELGFYLKQKLSDNYTIQLERNIEAIEGHKKFIKKELDIFIRHNKTNEKYCIEIKTPVNKQIPRIMQKSFQDIKFLEQLKSKGFKECFFIFLSLNKSFWNSPQKPERIYEYFNEPFAEFKTITENDVPPFIKKDAIKGVVVELDGEYEAEWDILRQDNKADWRYFILHL